MTFRESVNSSEINTSPIKKRKSKLSRSLHSTNPIDKHLKTIKSGEDNTSLELATEGNGAKIKGDLEVAGGISSTTGVNLNSGTEAVTIRSGFFGGGNINLLGMVKIIATNGNEIFHFDGDNMIFRSWSYPDNLFKIELISANGRAEFSTGEASEGTLSADIKLMPQGDVHLSPASGMTRVDPTKKLAFDEFGTSYITESADDILDFYAGSDKMLSLDEANDKITMGATNWVAGTVSGGTVTEFSAANSAYAGMILGYSAFRNATGGVGNDIIAISNSFSVLETTQGNKVNVSFKAPPSGNVEIEFSACVDATSKEINFSLSDNATYNELAAIHTYDSLCMRIDETDDVLATARFVITGLTAGTSYQYLIGAKSNTSSAYIYHGCDRSGSLNSPPIIVKAIALPATITTGD